MEKMVAGKTIATTEYKDGWRLMWMTDFFGPNAYLYKSKITHPDLPNLSFNNDIQVILVSPSGERVGDAVCHYGSYGCDKGLWETMIDGVPDVTGYLTFEQVMKQFGKVVKNYSKKKGKRG